MNFAERIDYAVYCESAALRLWGKPTQSNDRELRWGTHGARKLDRQTGRWFDHEKNGGGSTIELIQRERGCSFTEATAWLRREGLTNNRPQVTAAPKPDLLGKIVATYSYVDEAGKVLFQVVRFEPKTFRQRRPDGRGGWVWSVKDCRPVLYRLPQLIEAVAHGKPVFIVEGEKDADNLAKLGIAATTNPMGAGKWRNEYNETLRDADLVTIGDNDEAGRAHVQQVATALHGIAARVRVLDLASVWPDCPHKGDVSDWLVAGGTVEKLKALVEALAAGNAAAATVEWPEPKPLPDGLLPVDVYESEFMPEALAPWVDDIANRLQCPPDYVAVTAITALGAAIGRRIGIQPQTKTEWMEIPNLWGLFVGRPGMLKSPAMGEALKPIHRLEAEAAKDNEVAERAYAADLEIFKLRKSVMIASEKEALRNSRDAKVDFGELGDQPKEPAPVRFRTNDTSYEKLGELLIANPTGILVERDELISLLKQLDRDEQAVARGFYLSGWSGTQPYTFDRIGRGTLHVDAVCLSVLGNTQPARIAEYVRRANAGGAGGDGLIQRFGLMVWPDAPAGWHNIDEYPDSRARDSAWGTFDRLSKLDETAALKMGALKGPYDKVPALRFDEGAAREFLAWRADLEGRLRSGEMSPALEGHLGKYRKLVPALALVNHLADNGSGSVSEAALVRALSFARFLESHARRLYAAGDEGERSAARAVLAHIRSGDLADGFTARDIHRKDWAHLTTRGDVEAGLDLLVDLDHIAPLRAVGVGRPKTTYAINPRVLK